MNDWNHTADEQIDGMRHQQAADHCGRGANAFRKHMKRASKLLKEAYAT